MPAQYSCNVDAITVDRGDHCVTFRRGDVLVDVPAGNLESMIRLGQAVTEPPEPIDHETAPSAAAPDAGNHSTGAGAAPSWHAASVAEIGLDAETVRLLTTAGLATVGDVLRDGAANGSLTRHKGIGEAREKQIQQAIEALAAGA
jgi:hypothetical protein